MARTYLATFFRVNRVIFPILLFFNFSLSADLKQIPVQEPIKQEVWLTVFVHGIMSIKPHITVSNFMRFLADNVKDSVYYHTVQLMRDDPFFHQNQAMQGRGLQPMDSTKSYPGAASSFIAQVFDFMYGHIYKNPPKNYYYTYGWSGLLSRNARYYDSLNFYRALEQERAKFRAQGIEPKIRVIGYSHGGKIILNLAEIQKNEQVDKKLSIDEAIFLGMPVQCSDTDEINNPLFKKIYNIFSGGDRIQQLDFFSCGQFFSDRRFRARLKKDLPDKLVQVEIKVIRKKGELCIPPLQAVYDEPPLYDGFHCSRTLRNVSPGHTELWFFGWTPLHYRKTFPLFPLPIVTFLPYILNIINSVKDNFCSQHAIKIIIDQRRSTILLENKCCNSDVFQSKFLTNEEFNQLREKALSFYPVDFNTRSYNEHIEKSYSQAEYLATHKKCTEVCKELGKETEKPFFFETFEQ